MRCPNTLPQPYDARGIGLIQSGCGIGLLELVGKARGDSFASASEEWKADTTDVRKSDSKATAVLTTILRPT
jgi:hypothetical protein